MISCSEAHFVSQNAAYSLDQQARTAAAQIEPSDTLELAGLQEKFEAVAKRVSPAVVAISATEENVSADAALRTENVNPDKLAKLLDAADRTVGTGFIVDSDGYIATNDHVVAKAQQLWVTTDDRKVYPAIVVGSDPRADLAVLKIPAKGLPAVTFATQPARRGQWTIAIGNPYGLSSEGSMCVSVGVVSAVGRSLPKLSGKEDRLYSDLIQTTAQINPGNSGGPLFNLDGRVIGINTAVILPQKSTNGIGFAIPATERFSQIVADLKQGREIVYGFLGVKANTPSAVERRDAGLSDECGALIETVDAGSPADEARLRQGDIIAQFNGVRVEDSDQFIRVIGAAPVGPKVKAVVYRKGNMQVLEVALKRRESAGRPVTRESQRFRWRGMLLGPIPSNWEPGAARPANGVMVIGLEADSAAAKASGVTPGAIITHIGGQEVADVPSLQRLLNELPQDKWTIELLDRSPGRDAVAASSIKE